MNATKKTKKMQLTTSESTENLFFIQLGKDVGSAIAAAYTAEKEHEYGLQMAKLVWAIIAPILLALWAGIVAVKNAFVNARDREAFQAFYQKAIRAVGLGLEPSAVSENLLGSSKTSSPTLSPLPARMSEK